MVGTRGGGGWGGLRVVGWVVLGPGVVGVWGMVGYEGGWGLGVVGSRG